jgi:hypothetical protein
VAVVLAIAPLAAHSGGNPEHVKFPEGYADTFTLYSTANRANQTQVAKLYANDAAIASYKAEQKSGFRICGSHGNLCHQDRGRW